ncbi:MULTISPECIES: phosphohexomutase domain-containing protein [Vibrio]|uniref:phosphomannomutase/phosphoglucomutase n=1 Tax=Vibrio TaxID=662 RepID=UPI0002FF1C9D|nr:MULTISPECIES: phosphomannomutase/phosphoglucomutase [Vibrio]MBE8606271.1 phosphomannomutase/phosphoglucomutase [Vibrio sp. OPT10]NOH18802.1 phosphomannomutase/phosphoglucomutase [Vibrio cyclitrophicus]OBS92383.1 phosphomannomutase [Vibrio cyclitrophicus]OBT02843.1 phosphomannomutase [Vibrio cyclitrophicus]OED77471.1 phosphomannomutase [Vibrio cyclitrophicus ZF65]
MKPTLDLSCFKNNDIRGIIGSQISEPFAYLLGKAFGEYALSTTPETSFDGLAQVVIGRDNRETSPSLQEAMTKGLIESGIAVIDLGMTGTEEVYFATRHLKAIGGIQITASHNPINYNGMKLVGVGASPLSKHSGLNEIKQRILNLESKLVNLCDNPTVAQHADAEHLSTLQPYIDHLLSYIAPSKLLPMKIVVNAGNGVAGHIIDALEDRFTALDTPITFIKVQHTPDGKFPNGIPNPLIKENQTATRNAVLEHSADLGIAWDGDFDRCFFFDEKGNYIEGYYIVGLLAEAFLMKERNATVLHDMRMTWNTIEVAKQLDGNAIAVKAGHALIKEKMRQTNAIYGGEMSAHHYFRDFGYCDSGMIPWLLVIELVSKTQQSLYQLTSVSISKFPSSGEINRKVSNPDLVIASVLAYYQDCAVSIDYVDGLSMDMGSWRFNLRQSNTEPLIRLNVETKQNPTLLSDKVKELLSFLV